MTGLKFDEIPYRGGAPAVTDVLGDHVDFMIGTPQQMLPLVKAGKLKAFGVTQKSKMPEFPTADSIADLLGPKFDDLLLAGTVCAVENTGCGDQDAERGSQRRRQRSGRTQAMARYGVEAFPKDIRTPAASEKYLKSEIARWAKVIKDNNIHANQ